MSIDHNRRQFLRALLFSAGAATARSAGLTENANSGARPPGFRIPNRKSVALAIRRDAALAESAISLPLHIDNGDEASLANYIGQFSKGLPHSQLGEVDPTAYRAMLNAISTGRLSDFEQVPRGSGRKLVNPLCADTFSFIGADAHAFYLDPPPSFSSAGMAAEMVELYWQALARDVNFSEFDSNRIIQRAATEISQLSDYRGPRDSSNRVTSANIFRGTTAGDLAGPYLSQFLLQPIPTNSSAIPQLTRVGMPAVDYLLTFDEWSLFQSGLPPFQTEAFDTTYRYIRNGRDLAQWVHYDFVHQAYQNAALILLNNQPGAAASQTLGVLNSTNPYKTAIVESGFVTFGIAHICAILGVACMTALQAGWFQKWRVHRRLRPEAMAGRVHNTLTGAAAYPIHPQLLNSASADQVFQNIGTYLLPQAFVEGCPLHPSYPSGHACVAGACATILKAFFNEKAAVPNPVVASPDGLSLLPYSGAPLLIGNEANKLAFNVAMGRNWSGIHYRSDAHYGMQLGEQVAISILQDTVNCLTEDFGGFQFTRLDGTPATIAPTNS